MLLKIRLALIALANRRACYAGVLAGRYFACSQVRVTDLIRDLLLVFSRKIDKVVIFGADQERDGSFIESPALSVPLLNAVEGALPREVEHEENGHGVVAHQGQHIHKLPLAAKVPDGEGDLGIADGDGLLHEVDTQSLDVVFIPTALDVLDHQRGLPDLGVAHHADLDHHAVLIAGLVRPCCTPRILLLVRRRHVAVRAVARQARVRSRDGGRIAGRRGVLRTRLDVRRRRGRVDMARGRVVGGLRLDVASLSVAEAIVVVAGLVDVLDTHGLVVALLPHLVPAAIVHCVHGVVELSRRAR